MVTFYTGIMYIENNLSELVFIFRSRWYIFYDKFTKLNEENFHKLWQKQENV